MQAAQTSTPTSSLDIQVLKVPPVIGGRLALLQYLTANGATSAPALTAQFALGTCGDTIAQHLALANGQYDVGKATQVYDRLIDASNALRDAYLLGGATAPPPQHQPRPQ